VVTTAPMRPEPTQALAVALADDGLEILPELALRPLFGVMANALGVVSVDGAIAHAAVALGRPTLALFGPTDPDIWFPYARFGPYRVLHAGHDCSTCDRQLCPTHRCMAALSPDRAWETLLPLLAAPEDA